MRKKGIRQTLRLHVESQMSLYLFVGVLFMMGVIFGAVIVNTLSPVQKENLLGYLGHFFQGLDQQAIADPKLAFQHSLGGHFKTLGLMWILGISVIGIPFVFVLMFLKGLVIGFTVGFLVNQLSWEGLWFSLSAVVPQNLLVVPALMVVAVSGTAFSVLLAKNRLIQRRGTIYPQFLSYSILVTVMACILVVASLFEAYVSPVLMRMAVPHP
ncbi:stage II sporulation protein M [Kroppenstedtia eburnea]|uniref:Stage II sporulation protein M n=1 Tax=Kroppenstedtia eburnea TaxID=714067 RepID=A0A1N7IMY6_9BACL|nr:stage II sporulation protein M [Kroppenstedtia eburnea]EGK14209.1 stage II sporulation protein M [Desmospora sp. 8437]QKI81996.1 stage II sporulation protein M [Kroppenstedtia eburnea]SIS38457.1 stage II sporulation protein M [Kroppenstedtia eburnea]